MLVSVRLYLVASALFAAAAVVSADRVTDQQPPAPTFRGGVEVVQLDVSVLDGAGQPVRDLIEADFTIVESGVPQPIVAFEEVNARSPVEVSAPWMRDVASDVVTNDLTVRRVVVIVIDDAHIPSDPWAMGATKRIAREVVDRLGPDDLAAVTFTWRGRKQDITNDRQRLLAAIDSFVPHPELTMPPGFGVVISQHSRPICSLRGTYRTAAGCAVDVLTNVADALTMAPLGRKTLVYISGGLPFDFTLDNEDWSNELAAFSALLSRLQRANVSINTIDPVGLRAPDVTAPSAKELQLQASLRWLAGNTGGRAVVNTNAPWDAVPQILRESSSYYMIGFEATNTATNGRLRPIQVRVNRPDVEVRTRRGYYGPARVSRDTASALPLAPVLPDEQALSGPLPGGNLKLRATAVAMNVPGHLEPKLVLAIGLREPSTGRAISQTVNVTATAFDEDWKASATVRSSATLSFPAAIGRDFPYDIVAAIAIRPGRYQLRVGAEAAGATGSVFVDVDVPDFSRAPFAVSGLVMAVDPPIPAAVGRDVAGVLPVTPTSVREFHAAQRVSVLVRVVQGRRTPPAPVRLHTTIVDGLGRTHVDDVGELAGEQFLSRSADHTYTLPTSTLGAGLYLLTIEATQGSRTIRRTSRFSIR